MAKDIVKDLLKELIKEHNKSIEESEDGEKWGLLNSQESKVEDLDERIDRFNGGETEGLSRYHFVKEIVQELKRILGREPELSDDDYRRLEKEITYEVRDI